MFNFHHLNDYHFECDEEPEIIDLGYDSGCSLTSLNPTIYDKKEFRYPDILSYEIVDCDVLPPCDEFYDMEFDDDLPVPDVTLVESNALISGTYYSLSPTLSSILAHKDNTIISFKKPLDQYFMKGKMKQVTTDKYDIKTCNFIDISSGTVSADGYNYCYILPGFTLALMTAKDNQWLYGLNHTNGFFSGEVISTSYTSVMLSKIRKVFFYALIKERYSFLPIDVVKTVVDYCVKFDTYEFLTKTRYNNGVGKTYIPFGDTPRYYEYDKLASLISSRCKSKIVDIATPKWKKSSSYVTFMYKIPTLSRIHAVKKFRSQNKNVEIMRSVPDNAGAAFKTVKFSDIEKLSGDELERMFIPKAFSRCKHNVPLDPEFQHFRLRYMARILINYRIKYPLDSRFEMYFSDIGISDIDEYYSETQLFRAFLDTL